MEQPIRHDSKIVIEEVTDPEVNARSRTRSEYFQRNTEWWQAHRHEVLPGGWGKYVAVAGQEAFLADTPAEAWAWVKTKHPDDPGPWVHYLKPVKGPRIYAHHRQVVDV